MPRNQSKTFLDRTDAGRQLGQRLAGLRGQDVVVLGLPRGGVPVAFEVAKALDAPLDVIVVRKLGVPYRPEVAMGALGEDGTRVLDAHILTSAHVTEEDLRTVETKERQVLEGRRARYRQGRSRTDVHGRMVIVVDDGVATGSTARVACQVAKQLGAARVVLAVPVAPARTMDSFEEADKVVSLVSPRKFQAVGCYYRDFSPTEDDEVVKLLDASRSLQGSGGMAVPARGKGRSKPNRSTSEPA
ncbi:phosphoribosyltransferase [Arthrobacter sp. B0490]|uniref:phosphoribosyltransferase n=1 Tax=Arthrobacter sp. B0490 TaxID=2058891 RepID=UPI000CE4BACC|nr:phosphoribosyltransferase [Arthrobacter sp. B0490]